MAMGKVSKPLGPDSAFANFSGKMWYGSISKALSLEITLLLCYKLLNYLIKLLIFLSSPLPQTSTRTVVHSRSLISSIYLY